MLEVMRYHGMGSFDLEHCLEFNNIINNYVVHSHCTDVHVKCLSTAVHVQGWIYDAC